MPDLSPQLNPGGPASDAPPASSDGRRLKWAAIICFAATPFLCVWTTFLALPEPPPVDVEKAALLRRYPEVDTVVVGDSRVEGISGKPFTARGWHYFNMGLGGISPEDMALELRFAMLHGRIRRVVMGASFEGMTARYPFQFSRYCSSGPFASQEILAFATVDRGPSPRANRGGLRLFLRNGLLPVTGANSRLRWLIARITGSDLEGYRPDGTMIYKGIENQIAAGDYDFVRQRDPNIYFSAEYSDIRYLENPELSPSAKRLYRKVFAALRAEKIPCVVFETGRTAQYQAMIDAQPQLAGLQAQWREFFRGEAYGGITFLDASATKDLYRDEDFFDAVHFVGPTRLRLAQRLADKLAALETAASNAEAPPANGPTTKTPTKP